MKTEIRSLIHAELVDSNKCIAVGLMANGYSPILELCRRLVTAGYDPGRAADHRTGSREPRSERKQQ
jgi:hypothetical protein